jgi:hypothetical protein
MALSVHEYAHLVFLPSSSSSGDGGGTTAQDTVVKRFGRRQQPIHVSQVSPFIPLLQSVYQTVRVS